ITHGQDIVFRSLWSLHYPVLVHSAGDKLQAHWSPDTFVASHGDEYVSMIDSRDGHEKSTKVNVSVFFSEFMKRVIESFILFFQDWPPSSSFSDRFVQYYKDFQTAVPMPFITRDDGFRNLAAHYPSPPSGHRSLKPDLGPKVYIATRDNDGAGSTRLHLDTTSAVNILVYEADEDQPGALWHIFLAEDLEKIRGYLRTSCNDEQDSPESLHAQSVYLTSSMLEELCLRGVRPFTVQQRYGDAIFIPAGCAHQVSNTSACIKVACDFLCADGIAYSAMVAEQFRSARKEDILGLEAMLWHSWVSL
ncbi:hypothetical protein C8Q79DRAFT_876239, partial [Trametes meyenii]